MDNLLNTTNNLIIENNSVINRENNNIISNKSNKGINNTTNLDNDNYSNNNIINTNNNFSLNNNTNNINNDITLIDLFLLERSESSRKVYRRVIDEFIGYIQDNYHIQALNQSTVLHIFEYKQALLSYKKKNNKPLALSTVSQRLNILSGLFSFGKEVGYFKINPVKAVKKPKFDNHNMHKFLTQDETVLILKSMKKTSNDKVISQRNFIIGAILLYTGLRISELCSISWKDFYLDPKNRIGIRIKGKGSRWRNIKIRKELWFYISMYRKQLGLKDEFNPEDESPLFLNRYGERLTEWGIRKMLKKACNQVGMTKKVTPHWFRHTSASLALANGADIKKVMSQFGWSTLITPQRYLHDVSGFDNAATDFINIPID